MDKKELEALINKEVITDNNLIFPIWLNLKVEDVYHFSPLLVDKVAISANENEINKVITALERRIIVPVSVEHMRNKIDQILKYNDDQKEKHFLDIEHRIKSIFLYQKEYYNWYVSDETFNDENPWDDLLVDQKGKEFRKEYGIPLGDTELHYILYGLPHVSVRKNMKAYDKSVNGIFEIGIKNPRNRKPRKEVYEQSLNYIFGKYYT